MPKKSKRPERPENSADCKRCGLPAAQCWARQQAANGTPCCGGCDHAE